MDLTWPFQLPDTPPVVFDKNDISQVLFLVLTAVIGTGWIVAYAGIIRRAMVDHVTAMPLVALAINASWEFVFAFVFPHPTAQRYVNGVWFLLDAAIAVHVWKYGCRDYRNLTQRAFRWTYVAVFAYAFAFVVLVSYETGDYDGAYTAFGSNVVMSALFLTMIARRKSVAGQSIYIAVGKLIGSAGASALFIAWYPGRTLLYLFYVSILALDIVYVVCYVRVSRATRVPILSRF